jgi:hypothetical protein
VPPGTDTVERIIVGDRELKPGVDYWIEHVGHSASSPPDTFTLATAPRAGENICVAVIVLKR